MKKTNLLLITISIMLFMSCFNSYGYTKRDIPIQEISFSVYGSTIEDMSVSVLGALNYSFVGYEPVMANPAGGSVKLLFHAEDRHYFRITKASQIRINGEVQYIAASREDNGYVLSVVIRLPNDNELRMAPEGEEGWILSGEDWYYKNTDGSFCLNKWVQSFNQWYYMGSDGRMLRNQWIDDTYFVDQDGKMLKNTTTPDGYAVGSDGARVSVVTVTDVSME